MKKKLLPLFHCAAVCSAFLFGSSIQAQVSNPSTWDTFVQGESNLSAPDTFRLQTFSGLPCDNWVYTLSGNSSVIDITDTKLSGNHGEKALQLFFNSGAYFESYSTSPYDSVQVYIHRGGVSLMTGENLYAQTYRDVNNIGTVNSPDTDNKDIPFKGIRVLNNPSGLDLYTEDPSEETNGGYYLVDSVYAYGPIQRYSLFTGSGNWNDRDRWSHLPALRHRGALLNGDVTVSSDIRCDTVFVGEGELYISSGGSLTAYSLTAYSDDNSPETASALRSDGEITIEGGFSVEKTFEEKGKWYFLSLPFDVYASGIDPDFLLSDDTESLNGNYFYLRTYDGDKRASQESDTDNWTVVPKSQLTAGEPILHKNKGYLIALDEAASRTSLRFTAQPEDIPANFGKNGEASIQVTLNTQSESQEHNGWYLCGNPLPAPLSLNQISANSALDGYIYLYDGSTYQAYSLDGDYAIPAYSAFFVKASENTTLSVEPISERAEAQLIAPQALDSPQAEPLLVESGVTSSQSLSLEETTVQMRGLLLSVENLPESGRLELFNATGQLVLSRSLEEGNTTIRLALPSGVYFVSIRMASGQIRQKCRLVR